MKSGSLNKLVMSYKAENLPRENLITWKLGYTAILVWIAYLSSLDFK